jgi:hypothetical protein
MTTARTSGAYRTPAIERPGFLAGTRIPLPNSLCKYDMRYVADGELKACIIASQVPAV